MCIPSGPDVAVLPAGWTPLKGKPAWPHCDPPGRWGVWASSSCSSQPCVSSPIKCPKRSSTDLIPLESVSWTRGNGQAGFDVPF